jgi:hypothetical protein
MPSPHDRQPQEDAFGIYLFSDWAEQRSIVSPMAAAEPDWLNGLLTLRASLARSYALRRAFDVILVRIAR